MRQTDGLIRNALRLIFTGGVIGRKQEGRKEERKGIHVFTLLLDYTITTELAVSADC